MHEIQVDVLDIHLVERILERLLDNVMMNTPGFYRQKAHLRETKNVYLSFVVTKISLRGIPDSRIAFPTSSSLSEDI